MTLRHATLRQLQVFEAVARKLSLARAEIPPDAISIEQVMLRSLLKQRTGCPARYLFHPEAPQPNSTFASYRGQRFSNTKRNRVFQQNRCIAAARAEKIDSPG